VLVAWGLLPLSVCVKEFEVSSNTTTTKSEGAGMYMLSPPQGHCQVCATKHDPRMPHNKQSMYYSVLFQNTYGRYPTWLDAMAHCSKEMQDAWKAELEKHGVKVCEEDSDD